ncbi:biotin--[acetyl-CoA-carboxylase] ligase [Luethyella okanaganae]|uniref:biotin--[biotin carboxyl-carrier protein] ligase n=1 Tax=Luethyella okanaganae TaxID=69372 RepID=A0ABW1VDD6_9MICO
MPRFEYLAEAGSTNDELVLRAIGVDAASWSDLSVVVTDNQTRGRGRLGRTWMAPTGKSLAISLLLRPLLPGGEPLAVEHFGWLPLLAGAAMTRAVRGVVLPAFEADVEPDAQQHDADGMGGVEVSLKWPNDVLISGYKVAGILSELLPDARGVVIGAGLNVSLDEHDLPTITSTSLSLVTGTAPDQDVVLASYLRELTSLYHDFVAAEGDAAKSGLLGVATELCGTLGRAVRVELPGESELLGTAVALDNAGRLVVRDRENDELQSVAAGDVTHLRY